MILRLLVTLILVSFTNSTTPAIPPLGLRTFAMGAGRLQQPFWGVQECDTWTGPIDLGGMQLVDPTLYSSEALADEAIADYSAVTAALTDAIAELWPEFDGCEICYTAPDTCIAGLAIDVEAGGDVTKVGSYYRVLITFEEDSEVNLTCDPCEG